MLRRIFSLVVLTAVISSCGNKGNKEAAMGSEGTESSTKVEFAALIENPDNFLGKNIVVEGKVIHVCTETGKKLFIVGDNPDISLYIAAGENISKFPMELLGSEVVVEGTITRAGGAPEMASGEMHAMQAAEAGSNPMNPEKCETETALSKQASLSNIVMAYKSHSVK